MSMRSFYALAMVVVVATCRDEPPTAADMGVPGMEVTSSGPIVHARLTFGNSPANQKVYTTASISPAAHALVTVAVLQHNSKTATPSPTLTGGGMTAWDQVATVTFGTIGSPHKRLTIFRALSTAPGTGPLTITFSAGQSNCQWIVSQWSGVDASGANGAGAIVQSGTARGDAVAGLTVTLAAFENAGSVAYGVFGVSERIATVTPGAGFTEIAEQPSGENTRSDLAAEWATNDNTIDATWPNRDGGALGVEIRAGGPPVPVVSVEVDPATATLVAGATVQLTATPLDVDGNAISGRAITWGSDDDGVARVSATGLVTGVAEGSATITATAEGVSGSSLITVTPAPPGSPVVLVGAGDIADCSDPGDEATAALLDDIQGTVFTAGDNAYPNGSTTDFSQCYQPSWGRHVARTRPAPGNHDYNTSGAAGYFAYYGSLAGEPGRGYYSYDLGDWHVISLNSNISMSAGSPQEVWLRADLAASTKSCTIAYWHHPRFSSGTHHGSRASTQPLWQALYDAGAEIVIAGHEHNYERFALQTPTGDADPVAGIRQFVVGTGGASHYNDLGTPLPTSEVFNGTTWGVLQLTLGPGTYSWQFIPVAGETFADAGSGTCHSASPVRVTASPATITASEGSSVATITVTVRDANGNPLGGAAVALSATGSGNAITQPGLTDASGVATGSLSSTVAEVKSVSVTVDGAPIAQAVSVTVAPAGAAALAFTTEPTGAPALTPIAPAVQVAVRDAFGNRVMSATPAVALAIGVNPAGGTLLGTTTVTAVAGMATFSDLTIELGGIGYTLVASSGALAAATSAPFDVTGGSVSAALSSVSVAPSSIAASDGSSVATITVTARDGAGGAVSGATVTLAATGAGNTIVPVTGTTDANGVVTSTLSSTGAGSKTVSATIDGVAITQTAAVTVTAAAPSATTSTVAASPSTITVGTGTSTITVTVRDSHGNPVSGQTVTLTASGSGNTLTQPSGSTDASGVATGTLQSTVVEPKTVSALAGATAINQTATVTVADQPPAGITHTLLTAGNNTVNQSVYTTASVSPGPNALITLAVLAHRSSGANPAPVITGGGVTAWEQVASVTFDTLGFPLKRMTLYRAMSAAPGSGPITITFSGGVSNAQWIVSQWAGAETSGNNGSGAIGQIATNAVNAVSGLGVTLGAFGNVANVALGVFGVNSSTAAITPGSGFTEIAEMSSSESPYASLETEWALNHPTINALWTNLRGAVFGVEIKAKTGP